MAGKIRVKKRKAIPVKTQALFDYVYKIEKDKSKAFDSCDDYFTWVFTIVEKYNTISKTKFKDDIVLPYVGYKAYLDTREE